MREILFRAKRKDNGEWVQGLLWKKKHNTNKIFISCFPDEDDNEESFVVISKTVGQFTGLTDKNGTKIFEGDIVEGQDYDEEDGYGTITWDDGAFWVGNNYICGTFCENYYGKDFEVIGNIHDNPELLEGGDSDA